MITSLDEVLRLGEARKAENLEFRRYLAAHHRHENEFQIIVAEVQRRIDCTACANCCRYSEVQISQAEIETIARYLRCEAADVRRLFTEPAGADEPAARILRSAGQGCVFLEGTLCGIYEARPRTCRDFPHTAPGLRSLGSRMSSHTRWAALCPIIYNAIEIYKRRLGWAPHGG
jgi:Fe-S-cluster containining protein